MASELVRYGGQAQRALGKIRQRGAVFSILWEMASQHAKRGVVRSLRWIVWTLHRTLACSQAHKVVLS